MDMIKVFHSSLTIEDKTSTGAGNVRFSSSDTDISLSSSSIMSSSSSVSLFSFDGCETAALPTQGCAFTTSSGIKCNSQEDLAFTKPMMDLNKKESEGDHSILKIFSSVNESALPVATHLERITDDKIQNKTDDSFHVESLGYSHEPVKHAVIQTNDRKYEGYNSMDQSDCIVNQSPFPLTDNPILEMNLKNLSQCENLCKDFEKKKEECDNYIICDYGLESNIVKSEEDFSIPVISNLIPFECQERRNFENPIDSQGVFSLINCSCICNGDLVSTEKKVSTDVKIESQDIQRNGSTQVFSQSIEEQTLSDPSKRELHVHFPSDDKLVTGYVFPDIPWKNPTECSIEELVTAYLETCAKYDTIPSEIVLSQLRDITDFNVRKETFSLKGVSIDWKVCETLETIFKRVQFQTINLESTGLTEQVCGNSLDFPSNNLPGLAQTAMVIFDLLNYYEPCHKLILSSNNQIGIRGWQACGSYLRQSQMLNCLEARHSTIPEYSLSPVFRGIQMCSNLTSVHLQNSVNPGRSLQLLAAGLRNSKSIQDVYLGDNRFNPSDGLQLANLIKDNASLQLIDLRNNNLQDTGATYIFEALAQSSNCSLNTLIIWNNKLTKGSMNMLSKMLKTTKSLETINIGHNSITDEGVYRLKEGLIKNSSLLRIGLQAIKVTCEGVVALAEFIVEHSRLQKLDLRGNSLKTAGLMALSQSLKVNRSVTCVAMDTEEDSEKIENEEKEDSKKQYIQDILSYTVRNSDIKQLQDVSIHSADVSDALETNERSSIQTASTKTANLYSRANDYGDQSKPDSESEAKSSFQKRCQTLESPSILSPDVSLFPAVGKSHQCLEKSNLLSMKDTLSSTSFKTAEVLSPFKSPKDIIGSSAVLQASDNLESSGIHSTSSCEVSTSQAHVSSSLSAPPLEPPGPPPKPHISKRKFTVSKAILPSIFSKTLSSQQPSVLYTASSDICHDRMGVSGGQDEHEDAKVRIIGIQSEAKETTLLETDDVSGLANITLSP